MNTLKWATMSPVAPDDTPAFEQIILVEDTCTDNFYFFLELKRFDRCKLNLL